MSDSGLTEIPGYQLQRRIGRGGMAEVWLAVQASLGREVALKFLAPASRESTTVSHSPDSAGSRNRRSCRSCSQPRHNSARMAPARA